MYTDVLKLPSHVQLFMTPWTVAHQAPLPMEILQTRMLEWVAMPSSRRSSQPRDQTQVSRIAGSFFTIWAPGKPMYSDKGVQNLAAKDLQSKGKTEQK